MNIYSNVIEKIVYNVVSNENWIKSKFKLFQPDMNEYKISILLRRFYEIDDYINVGFCATFTNLKKLVSNSQPSFQEDIIQWQDVIKKYDTLSINKDIYLQFMRDEKLRDIAVTQEDKIRESLNQYLEFDSDELFKSKFNIVRVFGGAIRDIIANQPINDVDIICGSKAIRYLESVLEQNEYIYMPSLVPKDIASLYTDIHVINEPHTWIKESKIVQLIRPVVYTTNKIDEKTYSQGLSDLVANVDMSCCGVSYDGSTLFEDFPNAIIHCQNKVFSVNMRAKMYSEKRAQHRKIKLEERGWVEIKDSEDVNRDLKLGKILDTSKSKLKIREHESVYGC